MKLKNLFRLSFVWVLLCVGLCFANGVYAANWVQQIRSNSLEEKLQIVIDMAQKPDFSVFVLSNPVRVVVDVMGKPSNDFSNRLSFQHRGVSKVRTGMDEDDKVRVVLDLAKDFHWEAYPLAPDNDRGHRVVIDVYDYIKPESVAKLSQGNGQLHIPNSSSGIEQTLLAAPLQSGVTYQEIALESQTVSVGSLESVAVDVAQLTVTATATKAVTTPTPTPTPTLTTTDASIFDTVQRSDITVTETILPANASNTTAVVAVAPDLSATEQKADTVPATVANTASANLTIANTEVALPSKREIVVMIDPGHGGKDSGALGAGRTQEKNVVLQISKRLKRRLNETYGIRAILTRSTDKYISLKGRLALAQKHKPDLFVSIHADAARNRSAKGSSIYILSNSGASSKTAQWLADRENAVDAKYGGDSGDYSPEVSSFMVGMQQDITIETSHALASKTLKQLKGIGKVHKRLVERAGFAVLKSPSIPSMLVETAFISNPDEEKKLKNVAYQEEVANAIALGIETYFEGQAQYRQILSGAN